MLTTPRLFVLNAPDIANDAANMRIAVFDATGTTLVASTASGIVATASGYTATVAYDAAWSTTGVVRWSHLGAEVAAEAYDVPGSVTLGPVTLAASQPNYAPAKAGDAMTLTTAYDPAKTAAQASTALSTATWTAQKAGFLDAAISGVSTGGVTPPTVVQIRQELDANSAKLAYLTGPAALASQIPANFTTGTFASAGVFATAALANAPAGGGSSGDSSGVTTLLARLTAPRAALLDVLSTGVPLNLNQAGIAARPLDDVTTASLTVGDCLVAAASGATGKEVTSGLSYQIKTPTGDLTLRNFILDNAKSPTRRD
jgi:hypothetical protein